jgi:hypothetical protein
MLHSKPTLLFRVLPLVQVSPDGDPIDLAPIRLICERGLDECPPDDRALAWLVLSGVFPPHPERWESHRDAQKSRYFSFVAEFALSDFHTQTDHRVPHNASLMEFIHVDVVRTTRHIVFLPASDAPPPECEDALAPFRARVRRIERMLYVFGSLNSTLGYLQGFNELVCVLYYVTATASPFFRGDEDEIESLTFFIFQELFAVTRLHELFNTQEDSALIHHRLNLFMQLLKSHLPEAAAVLEHHRIHPLFFCFRWLPLLFAQDYTMPNLVLLWDALFAHFGELVEYATYIALAQVKMVEGELKANDFKATLAALQRIEIRNVRALLQIAQGFWARDFGQDGEPRAK